MKTSEDLLYRKLKKLSLDEMTSLWLNHPLTYTPGKRRKVRAIFKKHGWIFNEWAKEAVILSIRYSSSGKPYQPYNIPLNKRHNKL